MALLPKHNSNSRRMLRVERLEGRDVPSTAYGLGTNNVLFRFDTTSPSFINKTVAISGLLNGEVLRGIDIRPATGQLIAIGIVDDPANIPGPDQGRIYDVNPESGFATPIGAAPFSADLAEGAFYGFNFNPASGGLRIVNSANQNFRVNANTGGLTARDADLNFVFPADGPVVAVAYDQNFAGTPTTTLFGIEFDTGGDNQPDSLVRQGGPNGNPSPNTGTITTVGPLGVSVLSQFVGFDTVIDVQTGQSDAFAALTVVDPVSGQIETQLFTINLATGQAQGGAAIGNGAARIAGLVVVPDTIQVTGADSSGGPHVEVFDGPVTTDSNGRPTDGPRFSFFAYDTAFTGGVRVASGDVNRDGVPDIITSPGFGGAPHIRVFDGRNGQPLTSAVGSFFAYDLNFIGGVFVASADIDRDGFDDIITAPDSGGGPHVKVFSGATGAEIRSFLAYAPVFTGGVRVAAGDLNQDGTPDIVTGAGPGGGPHVIGFSGVDNSVITSFMANFIGFTGGVFVAVGQVTGDGVASIVVGLGSGVPSVTVFQPNLVDIGATQVASFTVYGGSFRGGVRVAIANGFGINNQSILVSGGPGVPQQRVQQVILQRDFFGELDAFIVNSYLAYDPAFTGGVFIAGGY